MSAANLSSVILAVNKHHLVGAVGVILGIIVIGIGVLRVVRRTAGAMVMAVLGIIVLLLGILLYTRIL